MKQRICDIESLTEFSCKEFTVENGEQRKDAFLIVFNAKYYAYENDCPHTGVNLNWQAEQFFNYDNEFIQCSLHGALFKPATGECIYGPCRGKNLKALDIMVENGDIYLANTINNEKNGML